MEIRKMDNMELVFGLDIGTRNVVGTVGYRDEDEKFHVIAQYSREHDTRSMLDGQIHDIRRVGKTIRQVKQRLEEQTEHPLTEVCIAAAGRVLKTVTTHVDYEYPEETVVTGELIHTLELLGVEKAQGILREENDTKYRFYCVGYSVVKYYINDEVYSNLEGHKAEVMSADIIVTFLPEDVVDGLYTAVAQADLEVANMTLEPIAAINVAIPMNFRMLNIALVDVGAGTSDICITKDGSIIAYGMIPFAGDEITEVIVQHYLVDFKMAEHIKLSSTVDDEVEFEDIMSITHRVPAQEVWELIKPVVDKIAAGVAEKIIELNGDKTVSATFVVGGGGKVHGFVERLSEGLELPQERVALRGEQVLREIDFQQGDIEKDPLIVTPVGICLNYYEHKNNFIMVRFNGERIQLYDNNRLTVVDAALQAGFPNEYLFPRRGQAINFTVNGKQRMIRGEIGESSVVKMNGREVSINTALEPNCEVEIIPSTVGGDAAYTIEQLEEYTSSTITFEVNRKLVTCPRFVLVNGALQPPTRLIGEGDKIEVCNFYTVRQLAEFMDVELDADADILVNNRVENLSALIYENFSVDWTVLNYRTAKEDMLSSEKEDAATGANTGLAAAKQALSVSEQDVSEEKAAAERGVAASNTLEGTADTETERKPQAEQEPETEQNPQAGQEPERKPQAEQESEPERKPQAGQESETKRKPQAEQEPETERKPQAGQESEPERKTQAEQVSKAPQGTGTYMRERTGEKPMVEASVDVKASSEPGLAGETEKVPDRTEEEKTKMESAAGTEMSKSGAEEAATSAEQAGDRNASGENASEQPKKTSDELSVFVNDETVVMHGKPEYVFIDVFDYIDFDLSDSRGRGIITQINDKNAYYTQTLNEGDRIVIRWEEKK